MKTIIPIICGPTSTGKTALGIEWCQKNNASIISADSKQIYKYMDIGTGKVPVDKPDTKIKKLSQRWTVNGVDIWGYDLITPDQDFSAYDYAIFASNKINELIKNKQKFVVIGGTGFYIDVLTGRVKLDSPGSDKTLRDKLGNRDLVWLNKKIFELNPSVAKNLDSKNPARLIRAIEKEIIKKQMKDNTSAQAEKPIIFNDDVKFKFIGLKAENNYLYSKTDLWLQTIWDRGLLDEVKNLIKMGFQDTPRLQGLLYRQVVKYLNDQQTNQEAFEKAKFELHAYIRRQLTWLKRNPEIKWFDVSSTKLKSIYNNING